MKNKIAKITVLSLLMVAIIFMTTACSPKISDTYKLNSETKTIYKNYSEISQLQGYSKQSVYGDLFYGTKYESGTTHYIVYNYKLKSSVYTTSTDSSSHYSYSVSLGSKYVKDQYISYFTVQQTNKSTDETETTFYNSKGINIASANKSVSVSSCDTNLVAFDNKYYQVNTDGTFALKFDNSDLRSVPADQFEYYNDDYYYYKEDSNIFVYNHSGYMSAMCELPTYAEEIVWGVLSNGKILVQYVVPVDSNDTKYDFIISDKKYNLFTKLFDPAKSKLSTVKCDVRYIYIFDSEEINYYSDFTSDIKNVAVGYVVDDKRINEDYKFYEIKDNGKGSQLKDFVDGQDELVSSQYNQYYIYTKNGSTYLYDANENLVGEISGVNKTTSKFFVTDSAVYDHNLNKLFDFKNEKYTLVRAYDQVILFKKSTESKITYYTYTGSGSPQSLASSEYSSVLTESYYFTVYDGEDYTVYNECGAKINTFDKAVTYYGTSSDDSCILVQSDKNYYIFY